MDWQIVQNEYMASFANDLIVPNWNGHSLKIQRTQQWDNGQCLTPDMSAKDIYLCYPWVAEGWREVYGAPTLGDFVPPVTRTEMIKHIVTMKELKPWRVYAGQDECQWMYLHMREILDVCMRLVQGLYPRGVNDRFVLGDCGCWPGEYCPNHAGAHNVQDVFDRNHGTLRGFNMTQYRRRDMPDEYDRPDINIWRDPFPYRQLNIDVYDTEKNYALSEILSRICIGNSKDFKVSTGILNHYKGIYIGVDDVLNGDDVEIWNHGKHEHDYMDHSLINYDAKIVSNLSQLLIA